MAPVNIAHRGLSPGFPENVLAAYRNSIDVGADVIELDLRTTADGVVVVLHDETVDRTTNGTGYVAEMTAADIRSLDAGFRAAPQFSGEHIPTYEEVLKLAVENQVSLLLDIKDSETLDKQWLVRLTESYDATLNVIMGVRSTRDLFEFRTLNSQLRTLGFIPDATAINEFCSAGVDIIRLWPQDILSGEERSGTATGIRHRIPSTDSSPQTTSLVQRIHELGLSVWVTTAQAPSVELREHIRQQVDGIITDHPGALAELLLDTTNMAH